MRYLYLLALLALLGGCRANPQESAKTANGIQVEFLFEHDGIRVYRFQDGSDYIYFTSNAPQATWRKPVGKHSIPQID